MTVAALFGAASVYGAFLGPERAKEFFNSTPLIVFWFVLLSILIAGAILSPGILKRPASLLMHVGPMLIIVGSMLNSITGHRIAAKIPWLFDANRVPTARMQIPICQATNAIVTNTGDEKELPFGLHLREFTIDYYPPKNPARDNSWQLVLQTIARAEKEEDSQQVEVELPWKLNEEVPVPYTGATLKVLEYIPSARPIFGSELRGTYDQLIADSNGAAGILTLFLPDGNVADLPVVPGKEVYLPDIRLRLKMLHTFTRARFSAAYGEQPTAVEDPFGPPHPALEVQFLQKGGGSFSRYALTERSMPPRVGDLLYTPAEPVGAVPDASTGTPAIKLQLRRPNGTRAEVWLVAHQLGLAINALLGNSPNPAEGNGNIWLVRPHTPIKTYRSDIEIIEGDKVVKRQAVEVNHPLHYGGYDFYQSSYGPDQQSTVLSISSDQGLMCVWIGFILICCGAAWHCWCIPVARFLRRGGKNVSAN